MVGSIFFYGILAIITALLSEFSVRSKHRCARGFFAWNAVLVPSVIAGLRYGIGTDFLAVYLPEFRHFQYNINYHSRMEFGYVLLNKLVVILGGNFQVVIFIVSLLTTLFIYLGLRYYKNDISVGLGMLVYMLLYYQASYNTIRQIAAMAIMFFATKYIEKRKFGRFCITTVFACSFHISGLLLFPFYFLYTLYGNNKWRVVRWLSYGFIFICSLFYNQIFYSLFKNIMPMEYYAGYLTQGKAFTWSIGIFARTLPFIIPGVILYKNYKSNYRWRLIFSFVCIGCILRLTAYTSVIFTQRIADYFIIYLIAFVPWLYRNLHKQGKTWIALIMLASVFFLWIYDFFIMKSADTIPYQFCFR